MPDQLADIVQIKAALGPLSDISATKKALDGICFRMDAQGKELFLNWLEGKVNGTLVLDNTAWRNYMVEDLSHRTGLAKKLSEIAVKQKDKVFQRNGQSHTEIFSIGAFPAYVGKPGGGYYNGYEMLHGANMTVGGMQVKKGTLKAFFGPAPETYTVTFREMDLEFNDITDPARTNLADGVAAVFFTKLASALNVGPPKDYVTTIRWRSDLEATVTVGRGNSVSVDWRRV